MSFLKAFLASLFAILFLVVVVLLGVAGMAAGKKPQVPAQATLVMRIDGGLADYPAGGGAPWEEPELTLYDARKALRMAAVDKRVQRVVLDISGAGGWADMDEMRGWIADVRAAKKPVYAFVQNLSATTLYLASAADTVWMPIEGGVQFDGFDQQRPFLASMLDKIGVQPKQHQIKEYKSAAELTVRTTLSDPARRNQQWLLDAEIASWRRVLQEDRGLTDAGIDSALAIALFLPEEAVQMGLVDGLVWWDDLVARWDDPKAALGKDTKSRFIDAIKYAKVDPASLGLKGKQKVAVVHAQGLIAGRESGEGPMGTQMGWESVTNDLRRVRNDKDVAAVVFRVDSPGGSAYTSEVIARAVAELQKVKPVVVSMGGTAASGGYKISYPCSMVVANELTATGSIGSITTYFNAREMWDKMGITWDGIQYGPSAQLLSGLRDWTPEERARVEKNHWDGYNLWVRDIARVRGFNFDHLDTALARGRVWTGRQAFEHGLIDSVGTLDDAIRIAAGMAGVAAGDKVTELHLPKKKSFADALLAGQLGLAWELALEELAATLWRGATRPVTGAVGTITTLSRERALELDPSLLGRD